MACRHRPTLYDAMFHSSQGKTSTCRFCLEQIKKPYAEAEDEEDTRDGCLPNLLSYLATSLALWSFFAELKLQMSETAYFVVSMVSAASLMLTVKSIYNYYFAQYISADSPNPGSADPVNAQPLVDDPDRAKRSREDGEP